MTAALARCRTSVSGALVFLALLGMPIVAHPQPAGVAAVPPRRVEAPPPNTQADRLAWQPGSWDWNSAEGRYVWRHGREIIRRPGATRYVPGKWVQTGGDWVWRRARWR